MKSPLTVLKFGSSVLRDESELSVAVAEIYRHARKGHRVLAVVSAFGSTTDDLLARAKSLSDEPSPHLLAHLLATGETTSAAMLGLALECSGIPARKLSTRCLHVEGPLLDSSPIEFDVEAAEAAFETCSVAILPGFVGFNKAGEECLLGRGGSDLTALFVAQQMNADECALVKDVDGLFEHDPAADGPAPRRFSAISHGDALDLSCRVVQPKALQFALEHDLEFHVGSIGSEERTLVGSKSSQLAAPAVALASEPRSVALLGLGAVGMGVYQRLCEQADEFRVAKILVRDVERHVRAGVPRQLLTTQLDEIFASDASVIIELMGGLEPATSAVLEASRRGLDVVTANKAILAERGLELEQVARDHSASLLFSASVGGVVPAVESVRRIALQSGVKGFEGVLNGTANFILDELSRGVDFEGAVAEARARGLAEADPTLDLDGTDVAHKVCVLAREAFPGAELRWTEKSGLLDIDPAHVVTARENGRSLKLIGSCVWSEAAPIAAVRLVSLPESHPLAALRGEGNGVSVLARDGSQELWIGKGAGRWPTTEAIMADLYELRPQAASVRARKARAS